MPPAIEVSGTPEFLGGGSGVSKEYGWYAVLVCILRFEDICIYCAEEKVRRTCWQGRAADVAGKEESRRKKKFDGIARGPSTRCTDILDRFLVDQVE